MQRPLVMVFQQVFKHGFHWCKTCASAHQYQWPFSVIMADKKSAQRSFQAQDIAHLQFIEDPTGEVTTFDMPDMQLDLVFKIRWASDGKGPSFAFWQQNIHVLSGQEL